MKFNDLQVGDRFTVVGGSGIVMEKVIGGVSWHLDENVKWVDKVTPEQIKVWGENHYVDDECEVERVI